MGFEVSRQSELFQDCEKYKVKSEFLKRCLAFHNGFDGHLAGFAWDKMDGYVFLTFFTEEALGFRRYPYFADRVCGEHNIKESAFKIFNALSDKEISEIIEEVRCIYDHTQAALKKVDIKTVNVTRAIGRNEQSLSYGKNKYDYEQIRREDASQAQKLYTLKKAAEFMQIDEVKCEMDSLNSFGENEYHGVIQLNATINASDIFYCYELLEIEGYNLEKKEWVVINKDPKGLVNIPIRTIEAYEKHDFLEPFFENDDDANVLLNSPFVLRLPQHRRFMNPSYSKVKPRMAKKTFLHRLFKR
jgi:hypothetical protein